MAKDSYWFKHDNNARNDEKILELRSKFGAEGYGIFWMIVETMAEDGDGFISFKNIGGLSLGYGVAIGRLSEVIGVAIELGLFHENGGKIFSNRMLRHKEERNFLSESGKNGAKTRWGGHREGNGGAIATAIAEEKREDKIRIEQKREENTATIGVVIDDIEVFLLNHQIEFEAICGDAIHRGISSDELKDILHLYHLWNQEHEIYPKAPLALIAGLKKWIINQKKYGNKPQSGNSNGSPKLGTSAARTEKARKWGNE